MPDSSTIWHEVWRAVAASGVLTGASAVAYGAAGGLTSALAVRAPPRSMIRQILMGGLIAGGAGTAATALLATWGIIPAGAIIAAGAGGSASYLIGVFGPAVFEVILTRVYRGRLPGEGPGDG